MNGNSSYPAGVHEIVEEFRKENQNIAVHVWGVSQENRDFFNALEQCTQLASRRS